MHDWGEDEEDSSAAEDEETEEELQVDARSNAQTSY
jgi:hypothetical protein